MHNYRQPHPRPFGGRGTELSNPWMAEELNMRRQNPQYHSIMQNMPPNMHSPLLNQGSLHSTPNKNFMNQSSCKMPSSNFTRSPNPDIFKSPLMNEPNFQNRFVGNRFPNNSYSHINMQHKMNDGTPFKDFSPSSMMSPQSHKSDGFSDSISKPLFPNVRQPQERFSCMQNDQAQFHSKFDNSRMYQEKGFLFSNDKDFQSQNHTPMSDQMSVGSNFSYKSNYRAPSLFPAYTPKDMQDESAKSVQHSGYNSDLVGKSNTFCNKTPLPSTFVGKSNSFCDKSPVSSTTYSKTIESFQGKTETFQGKVEPFQEKVETFQGKIEELQEKIDTFQGKTEPFQERNDPERVVNELFPPHSTTPSFIYDKQPLKTMSNSQVSNSFKTLEDSVTYSNSKYSYPSENQQSCFQSSGEIPVQRSQNMQVSSHSSTTSSKDCLMQSVPFSSQSDIQQNVKETFSSFNFESNINTTDIADLLPGLDAFLKEHLEKSEDVPVPKNDINKSAASNCAFSDDEWSKHSIPFIGDNQTSSNNNLQDNNKDSYCDPSTYMKEKCSEKFELKSEKTTVLPLIDINQPNIRASAAEENLKNTALEKEAPKVRSALEEAVEMLVTNDAIVGLDYIVEYKRSIAQQGSIPFRCKLCNAAITRPSIIDHILGSKHRMRYLKTKDESKFEYIISLKVEKSEKDAKISEAAFEMERMHGRGRVTVDTVEYPKDSSNNSSKEIEEGTVEPVFTLDKIPIGFEALSPQHEEMNTEFSLESHLNQANQDAVITKKETTDVPTSADVKKDAPCIISTDSAFPTLPGLGYDSSVLNGKTELNSVFSQTNYCNEAPQVSNVSKESVTKLLQQYSDIGAACGSVKRSLSPDTLSVSKLQKLDASDELKPSTDMLLDKKQPEMKTEDSTQEIKEFNLNILEQLSKSSITSEEEASVVLQVINMLMELLLRYKLQHLSLEKVEKLMKSLQTKTPENIEDLTSLLKDSNVVESKNVEASSSLMKDTSDSEKHVTVNMSIEDNSERQAKQELSSHAENSNLNVSELELPVKHVIDNSSSSMLLSTKVSQPLPDNGANNTSFSTSQNSGLVAPDNAAEVSKNVADTSCLSKAPNPLGLKPPPFFSWPQTSEALTNQVSYATVQGNQNMIWTSPYQHTQAQYAQMPYYQPQNYGNTFSGTQAYQAQYLPQNSVPVKMAQPPLPPPPPPPPPAPSNPPLPPLPNSPMYPSARNSHSVPVPSSASACVPMYTKKPPLPPPLP